MLKRGSEESYRRPVTLWGEGDMIYFVRGGEKPHKHSGTEDGVTVLPARFFAPMVSVGAPRCVGVEKSILGFFSGGEGGKGMVHADACFTLTSGGSIFLTQAKLTNEILKKKDSLYHNKQLLFHKTSSCLLSDSQSLLHLS